MFQIIKPSNPFTNVCWLVLTFSAPPQILGCTDSFPPKPRNEEMMGDGFPSVLLPLVCFEQ